MKSNNIGKILASVIYTLFALYSLTNIIIFQILGFIFLAISCIALNSTIGVLLIVAMAPNIGIITIPGINVGALGFTALIVFIKLSSNHLVENTGVFMVSALLALLVSTRLIEGNIVDLASVLQVIMMVLLCRRVIKRKDINQFYDIYDHFRFGCFLMMIGMVVQFFTFRMQGMRLRAIGDDSNYTAIVFSVLITTCLIVQSYRINIKNNLLYLICGVIFGLSTASRGLLLSVAVVSAIFVMTGVFDRRERRVTVVIFLGLTALVVMYYCRVPAVLDLYDKTVRRTMEMKQSYEIGGFMDITSGRLFLWKYYMNMLISNPKMLLFGKGFYQYYLVDNGGYVLAAHNIFISSLIGIGIIGSIFLLLLYRSIIKESLSGISIRNKIVFLTPIIAFLVGYTFLDGAFDLRIPIYILIATSLTILCDPNKCVIRGDIQL